MSVSIMKKVRDKIRSLPEGGLITYRSFPESYTLSALAPALSRLAKGGLIQRLERGKYFKPRRTRFGALPPSESKILDAIVDKGSYIAGVAAYNRLGLTTQVPACIVVQGSKYNRKREVMGLRIQYRKSAVPIRSNSENLYQILDALRNLKKIPDSPPNQSLAVLEKVIFGLTFQDQLRLTKLATTSKPVVRALLGAVLEKASPELSGQLKASLNPLTSYRLGITDEVLSNRRKWNIR